MSLARTLVLGVDGGNSKTDLLLLTAGGELRTYLRGPTTSHQAIPMETAMDRFSRLLADALGRAGGGGPERISQAVLCLAGADSRADHRRLADAFRRELPASRVTILNDGFATLRAGTTRHWGVAIICGAGVNGLGVSPAGRVARFAALGDISGDWGGGGDLGMAALSAAVRGRDGRGARTSLERAVPQHFGLRRPDAVTAALYRGELRTARLRELAPLVFREARQGDAVARGIIDRLADELAAMAIAISRRLGMLRSDVEVVLGGGIFQTTEPGFYARLAERIQAAAPRARLVRLTQPPVLGAALLALEAVGSLSAGARDRLRRALSAEPPTRAEQV
jgi:N-acetylglucosamine kinase-like BadF-type ATPase